MNRKKSFKEDLTGRVFGSWTVVSYAGKNKKNNHQMWLCQCKCGNCREVWSGNLKNGASTQCESCARRQPNPKNRGRKENLRGPRKGGRRITKAGYVLVYGVRPGDVDATPSYPEHQLVMEQHLGRKLKKGENVHHRNLNRQDNQLNNLELWTIHQPIGGRVTDLVEYATTILNRYAPERLARQDE